MRSILLGSARTYYMGMINRSIANMEVLLTNPVGIGDPPHQDIQAVIEEELGKIADYHDKLEMLQKFFMKPEEQPQQEKEKGKNDK
jgi:hypothetical protein|tara:strand:+ start:52 stop:309 length:258 start_codon:yes stop_codon:yes gene_type:complete